MGKGQNRKTYVVICHLKSGTLVICNKLYKTKKGLERHKTMKHQHCAEELINRSSLSDLISRSCEKITADKCFPPSTIKVFDNFKLTDQKLI